MTHFRYLTAGESHGKALTAIIEGLPSGFEISPDFINKELERRQQGYGRSSRQQLETDIVEITAGIRNGKTIGAPVCLVIYNKDFSEKPSFTKYRPGHADFAGSEKYNLDDLRDILERASARKTAIEVAVGAVAKQILKQFNIRGYSKVLQIGKATEEEDFYAEIDKAKEIGDTLGGKFVVVFENMPVGLGSYVHWDRMLDGRIAQALMSIPAVKAVEIGNGRHACDLMGSEFHDEMFIRDGQIFRETNNAGGIEGGMTNGENLEVFATMKPIPTLRKPLRTVDLSNMTETEAHFERSDVCAIEACAVVAEARLACVLVNEFLLKYGGDNLEEIQKRF